VKKLISIGAALALLAIVVLPLGVAAQCPGDYEGIVPTTYAKIPFAIVQSGFYLVGHILDVLPPDLGLPSWVNSGLVDNIGDWAGGPLGWSVDMLGWGLGLVGAVLGALPTDLGLPAWLPDVVNTITCQLFAPWQCAVTGADFVPCPV
jgi:hypothetical protein